MPAIVTPFDDPGSLAESAAQHWVEAMQALAHPGPPCVALSGGRIAARFFAAAVGALSAPSPAFHTTHLFWADERCVPPEDPESNYRLADQYFLRPLAWNVERVHRIAGELEPAEAARRAEANLRRIAPANRDGVPVLDFAFLGMGEDGHVASLFPGGPLTPQKGRPAYLPVEAPKPPPLRITLSLDVLLAAREVWVLASGPGKRRALSRSLSAGDTPLGMVIRGRATTRIFTDITQGEN